MNQSEQYKLLESELTKITNECTKIENEIDRLQSLLDNSSYQKLSSQLSIQERIYNEKVCSIDGLIAKIKQLEVAKKNTNDLLSRSKNEPDMMQGVINHLIEENNYLTSQITDFINKIHILEKEIKFFYPEFEAQFNKELTDFKNDNKKLVSDIQQIRLIKILYYAKKIFTLDFISDKKKELIILCSFSIVLFLSSIFNINTQYTWGNITSYIGFHSLAHKLYVKSYLGGNSAAYAKSTITDDDKTDLALILLKEGDYAHGVDILSKAAKTSNIAQFELYKIVSNDAITEYDKSLITTSESDLLYRAALSGNVEAQHLYADKNADNSHQIGMLYKSGQFGIENIKFADYWLLNAVKLGDLDAQLEYANTDPNKLYQMAILNKVGSKRYNSMIKKAAELGSKQAQEVYVANSTSRMYKVGMWYRKGLIGDDKYAGDDYLYRAAIKGSKNAKEEYLIGPANNKYKYGLFLVNQRGRSKFGYKLINSAAEEGDSAAKEWMSNHENWFFQRWWWSIKSIF